MPGCLNVGVRKDAQTLGSAEDACLAAQRVVYNLAAEHGAADIKPLSADQIRASLGASQRMLVFSVSNVGANVFLIGPLGVKIIARPLHWTDGKNVNTASLQQAVMRYLSTILREGQSVRGARLAPEAREVGRWDGAGAADEDRLGKRSRATAAHPVCVG